MNTQSSAQPAVPHATRLDARREIVWGFVVIGLFFGGILAWSLLAPLSSAAIAPGVVTVDGNRKTVQHLEGGIVEEILVRDGDRVAAGQALVRLRPLVAETEYRQLETRRALLLGQEARLRAEQAGDDRIEFPGSLHLAADSDPDIGEALADQQVIFDTRRAGLLGQLQAMDEEIDEAGAGQPECKGRCTRGAAAAHPARDQRVPRDGARRPGAPDTAVHARADAA